MPTFRKTKLYTTEDLRKSPSRGDDISATLENDYRRTTCLFVKAAGQALELPVEAVATALVFLHRFFALHSFRKHERLFIGSACLFLAAKVEESPKRVELVMSKCYAVWHKREPPAEQEKAFKRLREKILIAERCVLHTLGFQLTVEHPYGAVMNLLKDLFMRGRGADGGKGVNKALNRQLSQAATSFVNDSLLTTVCIQHEAKDVAAAVVYLSYLFVGLPRVETTLLGADHDVIADICDAILSLYNVQGANHAAMVASEIRDKLKQRMLTDGGASTPGSAAASPATTPSPRPTPSPLTEVPGASPRDAIREAAPYVERQSSFGSSSSSSNSGGKRHRDPRTSLGLSPSKRREESGAINTKRLKTA